MPTIDTETFQFIALVLLGVIAFTGLIALIQLGALKKALKELSVGATPTAAETGEQPEGTTDPAANEALGDAAGYSYGIQPLGGTDLLDEAAAEARGDTQAEEVARAQQAYQAEQERQALQAEAERQAQQAASTAATEEPQEQPFERDGRWWFRRGDELLVYEEATGQWVAAPPAEGSGAGTAVAEQAPEDRAPVQETQSEPQADRTQTEGAQQLPEEPGPFWKCPTCGAVNGSTATSCRMCFTQRPQGV